MNGIFPILTMLLCLCQTSTPEPPIPPGAGNDAAVIRGIAWLRETMNREEWHDAARELGNGRAKQCVVEAVVAYLLLLYPDIEGCDALEEKLDKKICAVAGTRFQPIEFGHFANWICGFSSLYVLERASRGRKAPEILEALARGVEDRQNGEGGWGHGAPLGLDFYPSTLVVTTYWSLLALGGCRSFGIEVDDDVIADGCALLDQVQAPSGGLPYGGPFYRKGIEAGRTSGVVFALAALGRTEDELFGKAVEYVRRNMPSIPNGHASPAIHVLSGALASRVIGRKAWEAYDSTVLGKIKDLQEGDGGFGDIVPGSPDSLEFMGGKILNKAYRTALYCAALSVPRSRFVARCRLKKDPGPAPSTIDPGITLLAQSWNVKPAKSADRIVLAGDRCGLLAEEGSLTWLSVKNGSVVGESDVPIRSTEGPYTRMALVNRCLLIWSKQEVDERAPRSVQDFIAARVKESSADKGILACYSLSGGEPLWRIATPGFVHLLQGGDGGIYVLGPQGSLELYALESGKKVTTFPRQTIRVNKALVPLGDGMVALSAESRLFSFGPSGDLLWKRRLRGRRGITPPAYTALKASGKNLYTGASDGSIACRNSSSGDLSWSLDFDSAVRALATTGPESVAVLTWGGRVHGVAGGKKSWVCDIGRGRENANPGSLRFDGSVLWVSVPARERLAALDPGTGKVVAEIPLPEEATWSAARRCAAVLEDGRVSFYKLGP